MEKEKQEINDLIDNIIAILKDQFYKTEGNLYLGDIDSFGSVMGITWFKDLSILKSCEYIFETHFYDDVVDCNTSLDKAETIDEAWKAAESLVYDYLDNWIIGADYWSDYGIDVEKYIKEFHMLQDYPF